MRTPETPKQKDRKYFETELMRLKDEAKLNGEPRIASILATLLGSLAGGRESLDLLTSECMDYSQRMLAAIEESGKNENEIN